MKRNKIVESRASAPKKYTSSREKVQRFIMGFNPNTIKNTPLFARDSLQNSIKDGPGNLYPYVSMNAVENSPVGARAVQRVRDFIQGKGMGDMDDFQVNENETLADLHEAICTDFAMFGRFALKVIFNGAGKLSFYHMPAEFVRYRMPEIGKPSYTVYYDTLMYTFEKNLYKEEYPVFEWQDISQMKKEGELMGNEYKGHCLFFNPTTPFNRHYGRPFYHSTIRLFQADSELALMMARYLQNNMFMGGILHVPQDPNEIAQTRKNKDTGEIISEISVQEQMTQDIQQMFSGGGNAGAVMFDFYGNNESNKITYTAWESNDLPETVDIFRQVIVEGIASGTGVPQILLSIAQSGKLGDSSDLTNAILLMNELTSHYRSALEKLYSKIVGSEVVIRPLSSVSDLPDYIFQSLPPEQKTNYIEKVFDIDFNGSQAVTNEQDELQALLEKVKTKKRPQRN